MSTVRELVNASSDVSLLMTQSREQETPLDMAARLGHNECFRWMYGALQRQLPSDSVELKPGLAFTCSRFNNSTLLVELVIDDANATSWRNQDFDDLILYAARFGSSDCVEELLSIKGVNRFDPFVQNEIEDTPLHLAIVADR